MAQTEYNFRTSPSAAEQRLIALMASVNFGALRGLCVRDGRPCFDPPPRVIREVKFGERDHTGCSREPRCPRHIEQLFEALRQLGHGLVDLEVRHGSPFRLIVEGLLGPEATP